MSDVTTGRKFWKLILFSILTCGIYAIIFYWNFFKDMNTVCDNKDEGPRTPNYIVYTLLSMITCGIYGYVWLYQQGNRMKAAGEDYGVRIEENGTTYIMWTLVGVLLFGIGPLVAWYLLIANMNKLTEAYVQEKDAGRYISSSDSDANEYAYDSNNHQNDYAGSEYSGNSYAQEDYEPKTGNESGFLPYDDSEKTEMVKAAGSIRFISGEFAGEEVLIAPNEELYFGRDASICALIFKAKDISRKHCSIKYSMNEGVYYITDYSTYGTVINNSIRLRTNEPTKCSLGTVVSLGQSNNSFMLR